MTLLMQCEASFYSTKINLKGTVHPKMSFLSFIRPRVVPDNKKETKNKIFKKDFLKKISDF